MESRVDAYGVAITAANKRVTFRDEIPITGLDGNCVLFMPLEDVHLVHNLKTQNYCS